MKRVLLLILSICFVLCGCSEQITENKIDIPFQKIAACNNRTRLFEKYNHISERTASRPLGEDAYSYWILYYEKENENINAILDYSADYKCYYYNNSVYAEYGDGNYRTIIPYREKYETIISNLLARTDTLSYVFILNSDVEVIDKGYVASYEFIVNNDILPEFEDLGIKAGDRLRVEYTLDKEFIIERCQYMYMKDGKKREIARINVTYDEKREFPAEIGNVSKGEKVKVKFIENFGTGSEYAEVHEVPKNSYITENEVLMRNYLYKDPMFKEYFDTETEIIENDTDIFIIDSSFADMLAARDEYMESMEGSESGESVEEVTE